VKNPMTLDEQKQLDRLREQLASANKDAEEIRASYSSAQDKFTGELRLYRGLFWCLLAFAFMATIVNLLQR
jgi:hypothetical protein